MSAARSVGYASGVLVVWDETTSPRTVIARVPNKGYPDRAHVDAGAIAGIPDAIRAMQVAERLLDSVAFVTEEGDTGEPLRLLRAAIAKATGEQA